MFRDRREAGQRLAQALIDRRYSAEGLLVLGIPRGGVVVAAEVARALNAPLDVVIARRLRAPSQPELAIGAVVSGDTGCIVNEELARAAESTPEYLEQEVREQRAEIERRLQAYRGDRPALDVKGRTVLVIDDGIATGYTFQAALQGLRRQGAERLIAAIPVGPRESVEELRRFADEVLCLASPEPFLSVGAWYGDFTQNSDEEVVALLQGGGEPSGRRPTTDDRPPRHPTASRRERDVTIPVGQARLPGTVVLPAGATGVIVFAHGSGSGRQSPRNATVAGVLHEAGFGTLLLDLLEEAEKADRRNVFDIDLLAERLLGVTEWLQRQPEARELWIGYFGASTGAGAALQAAARAPEAVRAIVSRGGRPDLAGLFLGQVEAPTRLIVGGEDGPVIELNEAALEVLRGPKEIVIVPGAGHLFEEPGTLEEAARHARDWFARYQDYERPTRRTITIPLTREQQLELAAATGLMLSALELDEEELASGDIPWARIAGLAKLKKLSADATGGDEPAT